MNIITVDAEKIRKDLMDYFGASNLTFKMAAIARVQSATGDEIIELAMDEGFDMDKYIVTGKNYKSWRD